MQALSEYMCPYLSSKSTKRRLCYGLCHVVLRPHLPVVSLQPCVVVCIVHRETSTGGGNEGSSQVVSVLSGVIPYWFEVSQVSHLFLLHHIDLRLIHHCGWCGQVMWFHVITHYPVSEPPTWLLVFQYITHTIFQYFVCNFRT